MIDSPDFLAQSAKNPTRARDAHVGLPSEEEIKALLLQFHADTASAWRHERDGIAVFAARAILSLIRPAFERAEADAKVFRINATSKLRALEARALSAEAKLAQAVEDEREACAVIAETAADCLMDSTFDGVARAPPRPLRIRRCEGRDEVSEIEILRAELDRLEAAAPLSARETARYLEVEARLLELESALSLAEGKEG